MPQEDGSTLVNAGANLDDLFDHFDWGKVPDETDSVTAGGWAMEQLGCIPQAGSAFDFEDKSHNGHEGRQASCAGIEGRAQGRGSRG